MKNKIRRIILEYLSKSGGDNKVELTTYFVTFHTPDSSDNILITHNYEDALHEFEDYDHRYLPDNMKNSIGMSITLDRKTDNYQFTYDEEEMEDYPIEDYFEDEELYSLISDGDVENIVHREIHPINKKTEILLNKVEIYFKNRYGNYKYNIINVLDDEEDIIGTIKLRISDHSENINNVDRYGREDYHISVVISDYDSTEKRFGFSNAMERRRNEFELKFTSEDMLDDILSQIEELIEECENKIIEKKG